LTDVEIAELTEHFKQNTLVDRGRYREVKPNVVLEVAFNSIQPSTRHASGLALRFPRIKAIRRDKNVDAIDTLGYARELAATGEVMTTDESATPRTTAKQKRQGRRRSVDTSPP
jgi:DNA ligase-1